MRVLEGRRWKKKEKNNNSVRFVVQKRLDGLSQFNLPEIRIFILSKKIFVRYLI